MTHLTIRARLTVVYGGLFLAAGLLLLGVTYLLMSQSLPRPLPGPAADMVMPQDMAMPPAMREHFAELTGRYQSDVRDSALNALLTQGTVALLIVMVAAGAFGWLIAGRALQPLHQITATARRIAAVGTAGRGLHERIALDGPRDEVRELADTFDAMLERLDRSFQGQYRFVANASHELRTPLTLNRSLIEVTVTRPGASADAQQLGELLLSVNERHERLIDGLLTMAESENEVTDGHVVDLADVAAHVIDQAGGTADVDQSLSAAPVSGDPVLLERLVQNLVHNATRHNVDGGWVRVSTTTANDEASLVVENTGPVIPTYEVETLFEPFRRLGNERTGRDRGFGLGLSIVRAIAQAHGGHVSAVSRQDGGLIVTVTLKSAWRERMGRTAGTFHW